MRILLLFCLVFLTNCAVPVATSFLPMSSAVIGMANGKIAQGVTSSTIQMIVKNETGKTVHEHLFTQENKTTN
jgi:hypothetical protein